MATDNTNVSAKAVQIVCSIEEEHTFSLDLNNLSKIILNDSVKDRDVVILSLAGPFRMGKSFLLNFFLRYLYARYKHHNVCNWLGKEDEPLSGFPWKSGSKRVTTGIQMWSDVFTHDFENGQKVAILLLDTQGSFDHQSSVKECTTVFALSTMLSSVQIFNISQNIQESDLQHLLLFTKYGKLAREKNDTAPFQKLLFLIRDWRYPDEDHYGFEGGKDKLQKILSIEENQYIDNQTLRKNLKSCFEEMDCFLMPYPGKNVATSKNCTGSINEISTEFKVKLEELIPKLLAPENLIVKKINNQNLKTGDLLYYFISYLQVFTNDELPEPMGVLDATAKADYYNRFLKATSIYSWYIDDMYEKKNIHNIKDLNNGHKQAKKKALEYFNSKPNLGDSEEFLQKLNEFFDGALKKYIDLSEKHSWNTSNLSGKAGSESGVLRFATGFLVNLIISTALNPSLATAIVNGFLRIAPYIGEAVTTLLLLPRPF